MKFLVALGGFLGFSLVAVAGFWVHRDPALILVQAGLGCLAGALLLRWFGRVMLRNLQQAHREQQQRLARMREAAAAPGGPAKS